MGAGSANVCVSATAAATPAASSRGPETRREESNERGGCFRSGLREGRPGRWPRAEGPRAASYADAPTGAGLAQAAHPCPALGPLAHFPPLLPSAVQSVAHRQVGRPAGIRFVS